MVSIAMQRFFCKNHPILFHYLTFLLYRSIMERVVNIDPDINRTEQQLQIMQLMNDEDNEGEGYRV
jgi:hypothetical protein